MKRISVSVNGTDHIVTPIEMASLLEVLRHDLGLLGTKGACEQGECGSCSVLLDGAPVCSCLVLAAECDGAEIITVEGLGDRLNEVQQAMLEGGGVQCGFCTPGFVVVATHLFSLDPHPTNEQIREALAGNLCRCTGYGAILRSLVQLSERDS
jgi:aerobic carbon-monoxide dehydrogenase small subunit